MATRIPRKYVLPAAIIAVVAIAGVGGVAAAATSGMGVMISSSADASANTGLRIGRFRLYWCGNGRVERRETCDDGNRRNGDGCSSRCQVERANLCVGHALGERFKSPDGCNTCVCTTGGAACTKMYCPPRSSSSRPSVGQKCLSSGQCPVGQYCTVADGDCDSACEPGAEMCIQACAGVCRPNSCKPIVCGDGTRHPSCSADGHPINYFADPCMNSRPPVCGDGKCQDGEANWCPACTNSNPPCLAPCTSGTCPRDCPVQKSSAGGTCTAYCPDGTPYNSCTMGPMNPCLKHSSSSAAAVSCGTQKSRFDAVISSNKTCRTDSDCVLFSASCPYVTCGEAINRSASGDAQAAADAYITCKQQSGGPVACAGCVMQTVSCVNSRCVVREQ